MTDKKRRSKDRINLAEDVVLVDSLRSSDNDADLRLARAVDDDRLRLYQNRFYRHSPEMWSVFRDSAYPRLAFVALYNETRSTYLVVLGPTHDETGEITAFLAVSIAAYLRNAWTRPMWMDEMLRVSETNLVHPDGREVYANIADSPEYPFSVAPIETNDLDLLKERDDMLDELFWPQNVSAPEAQGVSRA